MTERRAVVVVGDCTLDVDVTGEVARMSPEAPVPVLSSPVETRRPGGAALAALLAAESGLPVVLVTPVGGDDESAELLRLLEGRVEVIGVPTTGTLAVKTRWRAGDHAIARLDTGGDAGQIAALPEAASRAIATAAAVLVSDYGRGMAASASVRAALASTTAPVVWDPHPRGPEPVARVQLVTPNAAEAAAAAKAFGSAPTTETGAAPLRAAAEHAAALVSGWDVRGVAVTLGARGALYSTGDGAPLLAPAAAVTARDTCGAGDAFAAAATVALAGGALPSEAVQAGVAAAGAFVAAGGAAARPGRSDVLADRPVMFEAEPVEDAVTAAARVRAAGGTVVATGGCFDLLHPGHVALLESARGLGDLLVVCLNSDSSVRRLKGPGRPLQPEDDRARVLEALRCVDRVLVFSEATPEQALARLRPHLWVKGGDYTGGVLPEAAQLAEWGGQAVTVPFLAGRSTTSLVELATRR